MSEGSVVGGEWMTEALLVGPVAHSHCSFLAVLFRTVGRCGHCC